MPQDILAENKNNAIGGYGVNPNAKILPIELLDRQFFATDYTIAQGILHAVEKGAKVDQYESWRAYQIPYY